MVSVPTRSGAALAVTANVTVPLPVPLDAPLMLRPPPGKFTVTLAVHPQLALLAVIATGCEPAVFGTVRPIGGSSSEAAPVCLRHGERLARNRERAGTKRPGIGRDGESSRRHYRCRRSA